MYYCDCVGRQQVSPQVTSQASITRLTGLGHTSQVPFPADPIGQQLARPSSKPSKMSQDWQASKALSGKSQDCAS